MAWSQDPYSEAPWSGPTIPGSPIGQVLPPPIPGGTKSFQWTVQQGAYPWSFVGWSGAVGPVSDPGGGIIVVPDPISGVARVSAWWPYADSLQVVRITPDGKRTAVRGAYPLTPAGQTRTNRCLNPSATAGLNGYIPGAGNPTLSQLPRTDMATATAWRAVIAAAGTDEVVVPVSLSAGQQVTVAADLQFSSRPSGVTITVGWINAAGVAVASSVATLTANQVNVSVQQFGRQVVVLAPTAGAVTCSTLKITATGLPAGGIMDGSRITVEQGITDGSPYDGDSLGGLWLGVDELSSSILAPVATVADGECPLDVPVVYQVFNPRLVGGSAAAAPVTLPSLGDAGWLTHPSSPDTPVPCYPTSTPTQVRALQQTILPIIGRTYPIAVSAAVRQAPKGSHSIYTESFVERDRIYQLLADGQPLLLRAPGAFGFGPGQWLSLADITEDPGGRPAYLQGRTLVGTYQEVDAPAGVNLLGG